MSSDVFDTLSAEHETLLPLILDIQVSAEAGDIPSLLEKLAAGRQALSAELDAHMVLEDEVAFTTIEEALGKEMVLPFRAHCSSRYGRCILPINKTDRLPRLSLASGRGAGDDLCGALSSTFPRRIKTSVLTRREHRFFVQVLCTFPPARYTVHISEHRAKKGEPCRILRAIVLSHSLSGGSHPPLPSLAM